MSPLVTLRTSESYLHRVYPRTAPSFHLPLTRIKCHVSPSQAVHGTLPSSSANNYSDALSNMRYITGSPLHATLPPTPYSTSPTVAKNKCLELTPHDCGTLILLLSLHYVLVPIYIWSLALKVRVNLTRFVTCNQISKRIIHARHMLLLEIHFPFTSCAPSVLIRPPARTSSLTPFSI